MMMMFYAIYNNINNAAYDCAVVIKREKTPIKSSV